MGVLLPGGTMGEAEAEARHHGSHHGHGGPSFVVAACFSKFRYVA